MLDFPYLQAHFLFLAPRQYYQAVLLVDPSDARIVGFIEFSPLGNSLYKFPVVH